MDSRNDDSRGPRCACGHYKSEHDRPGVGGGKRCGGAYATLMADADDFDSVEVLCHCDFFFEADRPFEARR